METIRHFVKTEDIAVAKDESIASAIEVMYRNGEGVVVIIDESRVIGILTERDVVRLLEENVYLKQPVQEIAKKKIVGIRPDRSIEYALHVLIDNNIRRLVIIDKDNAFVGIVTQEMIISLLEDEHYRVNLKVSQVISATAERIVTLPLESTLKDAVSHMHDKQIGSVLIADADEIAGIITERDMVRIVSQKMPLESAISEVMSKPVIAVSVDDSVQAIVDMMRLRHIRRVLVTNVNGAPVGVIGIRDIIKNIKGNYGLLIESKLRHTKRAFDVIDEVILELYRDDKSDLIQWGNRAAVEAFGSSIIDRAITNLIDIFIWSDIVHKLERDGKINDYKVTMAKEEYLLSCTLYNRHQRSFIMIFKNVTVYEQRLRYEKELRLEQERTLQVLQNAIDQQQNIVMVTNGVSIYRANKALYKFFNVESLAVFQKKYRCVCDFFISHDDYFHLGKLAEGELWLERLSEQDEQTLVSMMDYASGEPRVFSVKVNKLESGSEFYVATFSDVTDLQMISQENYYKATHDALTGVYNRVFFMDSIVEKIALASRYDSSLSLILFDIDHFKAVNDTYGHLVGDEVLIKLAGRVKSSLRRSDKLARWGGEEFVILLPNTGIEQALSIAENLRQEIEDIIYSRLERVTSSFGVVELMSGENEDHLMKRADDALYKAKDSGRNCVRAG